MDADHDELAERGMPFRLYRAPVESVQDIVRDEICLVCGRRAPLLFKLRLNDYLVRPCDDCRGPVGLRMGWPDEAPAPTDCPKCGKTKHWPAEVPRDVLPACYDCLVGARVAIGHETELGLIDYAHSIRGMVRSGSGETARAEAEGLGITVLETYDDGSQSLGVHVGVELLKEMHRTPRYSHLQREYWPFHCGGFMAFVGRWRQEDFERVSGGEGFAWFGRHNESEYWEDEWGWLADDLGWSYVHKCLTCGLHRVFVDSD